MKNRFLIIDGSSLLYRAFYALPPMHNGAGLQTNAVYGLTTMLLRLIEQYEPHHMAVAFDKGKITFRNKIYEEYKGTRQATPPELSPQFAAARKLLEALGIAVLEEAGYEADDIIGTLAREASQNEEVLIVTGDRDALQLVNKQVQVLLTRKGITEVEVFNEEQVQEKYQVTPEQIIDLKGLMGDKSDNIPGIPGIGEKTAVKLLSQFGSVETLLAQVEQVKGVKLQEKIKQNSHLAELSKQLATIDCAVPLTERPSSFQIEPQLENLAEVLQELDFKSLKERIFQWLGAEEVVDSVQQQDSFEVRTITSVTDLESILPELAKGSKLVFQIALSGQKPEEALDSLTCYSQGVIYEIDPALGQSNLWLELLKQADLRKVTWDSKSVYRFYGRAAVRNLDDLSLMAYLLDPSSSTYELAKLAQDYSVSSSSSPIILLNALDEPLLEDLEEKGLRQLYEEIEKPLVQVLAELELTGIAIDRVQLQNMNEELANQLEELLKRIYDLAGESFNVNSTKQLGHILFEKLNLPALKKTKTGYSTNAEVLEKLANDYPHPILADLLEYRMLTKLKSTYLEGLQPLIHEATGRIYTTLHQTVTATGRLSSSDPNLQNIPIRSEAGKRIRQFFTPGPAYHYLLSADYSQIELRVLAHMSEDPHLLEDFKDQQDIHSRTAAKVFSVSMEEVTPEMRAKAKAVNFGIIYGISDFGLSRDLKVSRKEASEYIENYFNTYVGVKNFMDQLIAQGRELGYVTTLLGRRRYLPDLKSSNFNVRSFAERMAMNTPIQGSAADIIKKAMLDVDQVLKQGCFKSRLLLQVHDELILEVTEEEVQTVSQLVKEAMEKTLNLNVPLVAEVKVGKNWALAK